MLRRAICASSAAEFRSAYYCFSAEADVADIRHQTSHRGNMRYHLRRRLITLSCRAFVATIRHATARHFAMFTRHTDAITAFRYALFFHD